MEIQLEGSASLCFSARCFDELLLFLSFSPQGLQVSAAFKCLNSMWLSIPSLLATSAPQKVQAFSFSGRLKDLWSCAASKGAILDKQAVVWL